jgi:hypothetical protein
MFKLKVGPKMLNYEVDNVDCYPDASKYICANIDKSKQEYYKPYNPHRRIIPWIVFLP